VRAYDVISSIAFMALGAYFIIGGRRLGFGNWGKPGSGFIAVLAGCLLFGLSGLWFAIALIEHGGAGAGRRFFPESGSLRRVLLLTLGLIGFTLLLEPVGFVLSCFLLMVFLMQAIEPQRWRTTLLFATLATVLCVLIFQIWLKVEFPEGVISVYAIRRWIP
jgi:putative tricarboxylic transport membrane protein